MLSTTIIIFREILEIALIVGVLLAATAGVRYRSRLIWAGMAAGVFGSLVVAYFAEAISNAIQGMGQELFNAVILVLASALIGWTVVWMRRYGRQLTHHFKEVGRAVTQGERPLYTLAVVTMLAVLREGSEIVLFTYGVLASGEAVAGVVSGSLVGLALGVLAGAVIYYGLVKISARALFSVTSWLLIFLAAGMMSQAAAFLTSSGVLPEIVSPLWDTSKILSETNWLGQVLHTLLGYSERPSGMQIVAYILTLGGISMVLKFYGDAGSGKKNNGGGAPKKVVAALFMALSFGLLNFSSDAWATKKVYSPHVEQGEVEIEARGSYDFDDSDEKDGKQKQKYALGYGVNAWWFTELYFAVIEKSKGKDWEYESIEWANRFQLSEPGEWFVDTGLYFAYEFGVADEANDKIEGKLLLQKDLGDFVHIANLILESEVGGDAEEALEGGVAWSTRYRFQKWLEPGVEWHSDFGELGEGSSFEEQKHQLGPVIYGKIGDHIKYDVGYLFGVSDGAPDGMLKWIVEFEWHF